MKKIKIAMVVCRLEFGGVESVILNYTGNMDQNNYDFHIITQDINDEKCVELFENRGFVVHKVCHKRKSIVRNIIELWKVLKNERFDIVHSHMTLTNFYVLFLAKLCGVKACISHSHNSLDSNSAVRSEIYRILRCLNCICATHYFACGQDAADFLFGKKNRKRVMIFNNAIEMKRYQFTLERRERIRDKYHIGDKICIGHVGRFMEQKNQLFLLDVFAKYHESVPESVLLLIGDGELKEDIINKIKVLNLEKDIVMTGNINNVNETYSAMDMFLLPSFFEGLPVVIIEAQAAALPCLLSDLIDVRCKMTEDIEFISIDCLTEWVNAMKKIDTGKRLASIDKEIDLPGYNLKKEASRMEQVYLQCCNAR